MATHSRLAQLGALFAEPARAVMLAELMGGRALTATELAARADIAPSTASAHLARLVDGGLLAVEVQGRHRYYRLAGPEVARVIETLGAFPQPCEDRKASEFEEVEGLHFARTCYDHLAGRLAVAIRSAMIERGLLLEHGAEHQVTPAGEAWFADFGVDVEAARRARRSFARRCLDWTERRPHLAGALGSALLARLIERGWIVPVPGERLVELTPAGRAGLARDLGLRFPLAGDQL